MQEGGDEMVDARWLIACMKGQGSSLDKLVRHGHALVLAQVLRPSVDNKDLMVSVRSFHAQDQFPANRTTAPALLPRDFHGLTEGWPSSSGNLILDDYQTGPSLRPDWYRLGGIVRVVAVAGGATALNELHGSDTNLGGDY